MPIKKGLKINVNILTFGVDEHATPTKPSNTDMALHLNAKAIINRFGGRLDLWRRLDAYGHKVSVKTIEKWIERNSIPSSRLIVLMDLAKKEKKPLVLDDYIVRDKTR